MFGFEWNEKDEREALAKYSEARGEARGIKLGEARGEARGIKLGETRGKINTMRDLLADGIITIEAIKATGRYSLEEIAAITKP